MESGTSTFVMVVVVVSVAFAFLTVGVGWIDTVALPAMFRNFWRERLPAIQPVPPAAASADAP